MHDTIMRLWVRAEAARLTGLRVRQQLAAGAPGPDGSAVKLVARARSTSRSPPPNSTCAATRACAATSGDGADLDDVDFTGRDTGYRYLRAKGNLDRGRHLRGAAQHHRRAGASGLPAEPRVDTRRRMEGSAAMSGPA